MGKLDVVVHNLEGSGIAFVSGILFLAGALLHEFLGVRQRGWPKLSDDEKLEKCIFMALCCPWLAAGFAIPIFFDDGAHPSQPIIPQRCALWPQLFKHTLPLPALKVNDQRPLKPDITERRLAAFQKRLRLDFGWFYMPRIAGDDAARRLPFFMLLWTTPLGIKSLSISRPAACRQRRMAATSNHWRAPRNFEGERSGKSEHSCSQMPDHRIRRSSRGSRMCSRRQGSVGQDWGGKLGHHHE
eukprot:SAG11_NODE_3704_length_2269_cov_1.513825_1_plen_242_part_00